MAVETENFIASSTDSSHFWCYSNIFCCIGRRNQNYASILRFLNLGDKKLNPFDITHRFTHLFWLGDLNYRVEMASSVSHKPCFISTLHTDSRTLLCCGFSLRSMVVFLFFLNPTGCQVSELSAANTSSHYFPLFPSQEAENIVSKIKQQQYQELLTKDQLSMERKESKVFLHFGELWWILISTCRHTAERSVFTVVAMLGIFCKTLSFFL